MRIFPLISGLLFLLLCFPLIAPVNAQESSPSSPSDAGSEDAPAAIFVVRHAEKEKGKDPRLNENGRQRVAELVELLGAAGLDAIYSTQWRRTQETALPVAAASGLELRTIHSEDGFEHKLAARLMNEHGGDVVLVVGHSNTNPTLLHALGAGEAPVIADHDYDDVFVMLYPGGEPQMLRLGYGQPTP